jgi:tRNA (guanine37-N1)-methyltransferase
MKVNFVYLTIFPQFFHSFFRISLVKKAEQKELLTYRVFNLRDFAIHKKTDDYPFGGGIGVLLKIEPLLWALAAIKEVYHNCYFILLSPQGKTFTQKDVSRLLRKNSSLVFICGRYEGFDERILNYVDEQISLGDFITMGGEIPALAITEAIVRAIPGVIKEESYLQETFTNYKVDFPTYTRPRVFDGLEVPSILLSGDHKKISE